MKKLLFIFSALFLLGSCQQKKEKTESSSDSKALAVKVSSGVKPSVDNECSYDNEVSNLGIGIVIAPSKFDVYNDTLLKDKFTSWDMYSEIGNKESLCSKFFKPEYGIMHFVCIGKTDRAYKVLINYSDVKYLPITKHYEFKTWEDYILQSFGIRRLTSKSGGNLYDLALRSEPNNNANRIAIPKGYEMFCPMEIKDDWVRVKYDCFYNSDDNPHEGEPCQNFIDECQNPLTGWLRWKQRNKILIDIFLMP